MSATPPSDQLQPIWQQSFNVHSYQVNLHGEGKLTTMLHFLQEAAGNHARHLGVGYDDLLKKDLVWALSRLTVQMDRYPNWNDTLTIETWPSSYDRIFAYRDLLFLDHEGGILGKAKTAWVLMNIQTRRMASVGEHVKEFQHFPDKLTNLDGPKKLSKSLPAIEPLPYQVVYEDLDTNEHVNNTRYAGWMINHYPYPFLKSHQIEQLSINYLREALPEQSLLHYYHAMEENPTTFRHVLTDEKQSPICTAVIKWKKRIGQ